MPLLSDEDQKYLKEHFQKNLTGDVKLVFFTQKTSLLPIPGQECQECKDTRQILEEVAALSDMIHLEVYDFVAHGEIARAQGVDKIPATVFVGANKGQLRYFGIPSGYEFPTLIEDIIYAARGQTDLSARTRKALAKVNQPLHIQVFATPT